jgi:predicted kinase
VIEELARRIAEFHSRAERNDRIAEAGRFDNVARLARQNFRKSEDQVGTTVSPAVFSRLELLTDRALREIEPLIEQRVARGVPCDTHGDLRLDQVYLFPDLPPPRDLVVVDAIEFNEAFRAADPVADMAFLVMDMIAHDHRDLARSFGDAYFSASRDHAGRRLLPFYVAYRAAVRGKVEGLKASEPEIAAADRAQARAEARARWLVALGEIEDPGRRPALLLVGGLTGAGKSTLARELARRVDFHVIRSDEVRKELAGVDPSPARAAGFEEGIYSPEWTERTYQACLERAEAMLFAGRRVLVDATFRDEARRRAFLELAASLGVPGLVLVCRADPGHVQARLEARRHDVSDADWSIYLRSARRWEPLGPRTDRKAHIIPTDGAPEVAVDRAIRVLRQDRLLD